ncbi:MAG: patatin-like phospholipase family protein [Bryobacteraceae bacterium]
MEVVMRRDSVMVSRMRDKSRLLNAGDPGGADSKLVILACGGGLRGAFGGGVLVGLSQLGFREVFDVAVGVSAGAANIAYFLSGQTRIGMSIYLEEMVSSRFLNPARLWKIADLDFIEHIFRHSPKCLDVNAVKRARSEFYVGSTNTHGKGEFINAKLSADMVATLKGSMALPILYNRVTQVEQGGFVDGDVSLSLAVPEVMEMFRPNDLLIVMNRPFANFKDPFSFLQRVFASLFLRGFSREFRRAYFDKNADHNRRLRSMHSGACFVGANVSVICPDYEMPLFTRDSGEIRRFADSGTEKILAIFDERASRGEI